MKRNLKLFCSTKITQIHATITLEDDIGNLVAVQIPGKIKKYAVNYVF
jgi:hypothetical protein